MVKSVHHVGVVVKSIEETFKVFEDVFGFRELRFVVDPAGTFRSCLISANNARFELIEPLGNQGVISRFLEKKGEGLHHVSLEVDNLETTVTSLKNKDVRLINQDSQTVGDFKVAFVHPASVQNIMIELVEKADNGR
jgi:methylmalonyl-CoA epimerase